MTVDERHVIEVTCWFVYRFVAIFSSSDVTHSMPRTRVSAKKVTGGTAPRSNWKGEKAVTNQKPSTPQVAQSLPPKEPQGDGEGYNDAENVSQHLVFKNQLKDFFRPAASA